MNWMLDAGSGRPVPASVTLPRIRTPRRSLMSWVALTVPLVHLSSSCWIRYGSPPVGKAPRV